MTGVNKVILVGRLGQDPSVRYMTNGEAVTNATLATSETWKDKQGEKQEKTEWHNLVFYRRLAEIAGEYLQKGSQAYVEGRIQTRKYTTKEGEDRYITEIIVNELHMFGSKQSGERAAAPEHQAEPEKAAEPNKTVPKVVAPAKRAAPKKPESSEFDFDEDTPF